MSNELKEIVKEISDRILDDKLDNQTVELVNKAKSALAQINNVPDGLADDLNELLVHIKSGDTYECNRVISEIEVKVDTLSGGRKKTRKGKKMTRKSRKMRKLRKTRGRKH